MGKHTNLAEGSKKNYLPILQYKWTEFLKPLLCNSYSGTWSAEVEPLNVMIKPNKSLFFLLFSFNLFPRSKITCALYFSKHIPMLVWWLTCLNYIYVMLLFKTTARTGPDNTQKESEPTYSITTKCRKRTTKLCSLSFSHTHLRAFIKYNFFPCDLPVI